MKPDSQFDISRGDGWTNLPERTERSPWQLSVQHLFALTAGSAVAVTIFQAAGWYWCLLLLVAVACIRIPAYDGINPVVQAIAYAAIVLALTCGLAYAFDVSPVAAIVPCCLMPSLAYLVGFAKGMNGFV